ncbi:unnamed protein product [Calypogeia fissa]
MEFTQDGCGRSGWLKHEEEPLKQIHIVDTMPDFHYDTSLKSMYMDVVKPTEDQRLNRSSKTGLLLRDNETISGPCSLSTEGIPGAQVPPLYKFTNRGAHAFSNLSKTWEDLPRSTPKVLIPEHVKRPSNILDSRDIKGTTPHPKNMKIGDEARNTNPVDPHYSLPSYPEPFIPLPKFVKNSLDVADIEGTRPSSRQKKGVYRSEERGSLRVIDIEGTQPGWKPFYRRQFGKVIRNLSLTAEDINGPIEERVVRPINSEVYQDIDGSHCKEAVGRRPGTPHTLSLRNDDIEGAYAGSGSWEGTTRRKKEFAKSHTRDLNEQKDAEDVAVNILTTRVQEQLKRKGLLPRDVATTFHQLDRQNSGKLDINEVSRAFKTLRLDVDPTELTSISKAFVHPTGDGYLDYWKLVRHLVPVFPQQRGLQRDVSDVVARSVNHDIKSGACHKPCYDPAWVAEVVERRECRVPDGESGTQFQAFNSGRPINYDPSKYLKDPPSKHAFEVHQQPLIQTVNCTSQNITQPVEEPTSAAADYPPSKHAFGVHQQPLIQTVKCTSHNRSQSVEGPNSAASDHKPNSQASANSVPREVPVLSVLPEPSTQPTWVNKDIPFQEIISSKPKEVRGKEESLFSELKGWGLDFSPGETNATSVPIFYKLKGMNSYEAKPLPLGGPFWPGYVDPQPEDIAPHRPRTPSRMGPLPLGGAFWSGVERPHSAPRISLRRDYMVPPLFSDISSDVNLRQAGQKEKVPRTWIDTIGHAASATPFVGEGDCVLPRPGMQGSTFSRPSSAILPHSYEHRSNWKSSDQLESRLQTATSLAHSCPSHDWTPEAVLKERGRPQTVNSVARGSPSENILSSNCERKLVSAMKRPSTAQSVTSTVRSGVTFSPLPTRPCTPYGPVSPTRSPCVVRTDETLSTRIKNQSQHRSNSGKTKSSPLSAQRHQAQLWEDIRSVRLLV